MLLRPRRIDFVDQNLKDSFEKLALGSFEEKELYSQINSAFDYLFENPLSGKKIERKKWPKEYIKKYEITNLWKYNLSDGWRLIYTIQNQDIQIVTIVLEWFSHKDYERRFGY